MNKVWRSIPESRQGLSLSGELGEFSFLLFACLQKIAFPIF